MAEAKKGLLCKLGLHRRIYHDSAMFSSARRCGVCGDYVNPAEGRALERERELWTNGVLSYKRDLPRDIPQDAPGARRGPFAVLTDDEVKARVRAARGRLRELGALDEPAPDGEED